ncbi:probable chitinase 2 [Macrosteles quadrilineatus]|uniref:probable chitinase 2 n=1 Tax=Macrosteles quadrilineatus TaxID=74068 RepID=UPI0023E3408D|nr:probable chitinase 2 [Macrosteles quadrilineatus]
MSFRVYIVSCVLSVLFTRSFSLTTTNRESRPNHDRVVACYVSSWATYRSGHGTFNIDDIDPTLCTHLIYAFAGLNTTDSSIRSLDPYNDLQENYGKGSYKKMTELRKKYPHLTVSIAIGGWNEGSSNYSKLAADYERRRLFVDSVVRFLRMHDFNGFDLDWEFPTKRGGAPEDRENFVKLVKELHSALKPEGWSLTAALGAGKDAMETGYDLRELNKYLDHVHLMCYDYHGKWDNTTGANAPLHSSISEDVNTVEYSVNYMLRNGIEPHKLVLGLPMYGRTFKTQSPNSDKLGSPSLNAAFSGPYTREDGFMGFNEICTELSEPNSTWKKLWDEASLTPFAVSEDKVIVYDDPQSLRHKVKFAMEKQLGGVMIWSLDIDDFRGLCTTQEGEKHKFQLLRSVNVAIEETLNEIETEKKNGKKQDTSGDQDENNSLEPSGTSTGFISTTLLLAVFIVHNVY